MVTSGICGKNDDALIVLLYKNWAPYVREDCVGMERMEMCTCVFQTSSYVYMQAYVFVFICDLSG